MNPYGVLSKWLEKRITERRTHVISSDVRDVAAARAVPTAVAAAASIWLLLPGATLNAGESEF